MPNYLGPYDVVVIDGKQYQRGDNVNVSADRLRQLQRESRYVFDGDEQPSAAPIMSDPAGEVHPPNEYGVPEPLKSQSATLKQRAADDNTPVPVEAGQPPAVAPAQ